MWKKRRRRVHSPGGTKPRAAAIGLICLVLAGGAGAQGASFGQPTPGICFLSRERVLDQSKAGAAANQRMQLFMQGVERELSGERAAIGADANVLQIQRPVINESIYQQRAGALALREQSFQALENTRNDQLARTRAAVTARLVREMAPTLAAVLSEHGCSAVLETSGAYAVNPRMDLTAEVIQVMDARLAPFNFNLESPAR
jgi:Skp family chaperone for outer membrane proteins